MSWRGIFSKRVRLLEAREKLLKAEIEMLSSSGKMTSEFYQNMSHDFKTPLTVISTSLHNAVDLLEQDYLEKSAIDEAKESLSNIQSEVMRLARLVSGAAQLSYLYDGKQGFAQINVERLLSGIARNYRVLLDRNGNTLTLNVPQGLPLLSANADMVTHVLANLLSNANRHTKNGTIGIEAATGGKAIIISVKDNGTGIEPNILGKLFERGVTTRSNAEGAGLGLAICKTIIEQAHGGRIWAQSKPGAGTTVTFEIPIHSS